MADTKKTLSKKQREILDYLKKEIIEKGFPPSVREICTAVNLKSTSSVHAHLEALEKKGYIRKDATKPRAIEILDDGFNEERLKKLSLSSEEVPGDSGADSPYSPVSELPEEYQSEIAMVPVVGDVAAGQPLLAVEQITSYFPVPVDRLPNQQTFLLKVKGESMINAGILDGDYVLVEQTDTASNGEMVVALVEDSATVKTFYKEDGYYRLQPQNDFMDPILVHGEVQILGKVIGVLRFFND